MIILGRGIYGLTEAARMVEASQSTVRQWLTGTPRTRRDPVLSGDYRPLRSRSMLVSFLDMIDMLIVGRLRTIGVTMQYIRKVYDGMVDEFQTPHPFSRKELLTDGKRIFMHTAQAIGDNKLTEMLSRQQAFPRILLPALHKLDYDVESLLARRWHIARGIVVDPTIQYGKPVVAKSFKPTCVLATVYYANAGNARQVADWYGIAVSEVNAAVRFEAKTNGVAA